MKMLESVKEVHDFIAAARKAGKKVGFVPTMGALHEGHLSLMRKAKKENGVVVVSIFVNPMQFGAGEDFERYPRNLQADVGKCATAGVDAIFSPSVAEIYPKGFKTFVDMEDLPNHLCGRSRPGHFRGVMTVVGKLFHIVPADTAYFGQKDYQQAQILQRMAEDLNFPIQVRILPTFREDDGLAMSSRNAYLTPAQRQDATVLHQALVRAREMIVDEREGSSAKVIEELKRIVKKAKGAKVDYIAVAHPETLDDVREIRGRVLVALAVHLGKARLIDNDLIP